MLEWIFRNIPSYVVGVSILVAFHEFGHFWMARRFGIKVLRYSIGFGKPLWQRDAKDGVNYRISAIPLGGYVKLLDEREGEVAEADRPRAFNRQPVAVRIAVFAAGPVFNFVLAVFFYWLLFVVGVPSIKSAVETPAAASVAARAGIRAGEQVIALDRDATPTWSQLQSALLDHGLAHDVVAARVRAADGSERKVTLDLGKVSSDPMRLFEDIGLRPYAPPLPPVLGEIVPGSAATRAGLRRGDRIRAVDGEAVDSFQRLVEVVSARPGRTVRVEYTRDGFDASAEATLADNRSGGRSVGQLGAQSAPSDPKLWQDLRAELRLGPVAAVPAALAETWNWSKRTLQLIARMLTGEISVKNISGPASIAEAAGTTASYGVLAFIDFLAKVSISLGIFNLLPVPMLDGGQILFGLIEAVKGSPLSDRLQMIGQQMGLLLLALLMGLAIFNDVTRILG